MNSIKRNLIPAVIAAALLGAPGAASANPFVQCPWDGDLVPADGNLTNDGATCDALDDVCTKGGVSCMHITGGDGFITMGDGRELYIFSFAAVSEEDAADVLDVGVFRANHAAPTISVREGDKFFLTLTNVGTFNRPDLFDPHTVHYHGFPNASDLFDGSPDNTFAINQQASLTYWYDNVFPGTYMWHCHVEATEHMQMGMLGNINVLPGQDVDGCATGPCGPGQYVYNDDDGSTAYDVSYPIMIGAMDGDFHDQSEGTQPLAFAAMSDQYPMLNGRGYPDTTVAGPLPPPASGRSTDPISPQQVSSLIEATQGDTILLRVINLGQVQSYTLTALGVPMKVVGRGARLLRGAGQAVGANVYVDTNNITLGGGESADVLIDTSDVVEGTYFLYTTNLNYLSNNEEDFGGMMTEIVIN